MATNNNNLLNSLLQYQYNNINKNTMKFTKSQRHLHQPNYNPPCNVYQTLRVPNTNKILTGSLAPPCILNKNTFGFQSRFDSNIDQVPGPGSYLQVQKFKKQNKNARNLIKGGRLQLNQQNAPSIPCNYYGQVYDEQEQKYITNLHLKQNLLQSSKVISKKEPSYSFSKQQRNYTYIPKKQILSNIPELQFESKKNGQSQKDSKDTSKMKNNNVIYHQTIKKATLKRLQAIQQIDPSYVPSLELIDLIRRKRNKPMPGPGQYNSLNQVETQFRLFLNPKGTSFTSSKRFLDDKNSSISPGQYDPKMLQNSQKYSFGKSLRENSSSKKQDNYRYYINPQPSDDMNEKIRQRGMSCPFGSNASRFPETLENQSTALTLSQERKRIKNQKINKQIKARLKIHKKLNEFSNQDDGLLGISTMASTID